MNLPASVAQRPSWKSESSRWWWSLFSTMWTSSLARNSAHSFEREQVCTGLASLASCSSTTYCCYSSNKHFAASSGHNSLSRPKSLLISSPSTKLLSLEEAQARTQAQINSPVTEDSKYIEVGEGPAALQGKFHTVIEFPTERSVSFSSCPGFFFNEVFNKVGVK